MSAPDGKISRAEVLRAFGTVCAGHCLHDSCRAIRHVAETIRQLPASPSVVVAVPSDVVRTIMRGFHEGVFVRSTANDHRSDWAIKAFPFLRALAQAQEIVGDGCLNEDCPIHGGPNPEGQP